MCEKIFIWKNQGLIAATIFRPISAVPIAGWPFFAKSRVRFPLPMTDATAASTQSASGIQMKRMTQHHRD